MQQHLKILWLGRGWDSFAATMQKVLNENLPSGFVAHIEKPKRDENGNFYPKDLADADVLIASSAHITAELLSHCNRLKLVFQPAAGFETIDLAACQAFGVPVCNCPGQNARTTAESTILLILAGLRRLPEILKSVQTGILGGPSGHDLSFKTVGIVGEGNIGSLVGEMLTSAFKCEIISTNSRSTREEFENLLRKSDIVTLNCPLNAKTRNMISSTELQLMKPSAVLVNASRGHLIDKTALKEALQKKQISFFASDVFWNEPADPEDEFLQLPNVLILPHVGGSTVEVEERFGRLLLDATKSCFIDKQISNLKFRIA